MQEQEAGPTFIQANILPEEQSRTTTQAIEENISNLESYLHKKLSKTEVKSLIKICNISTVKNQNKAYKGPGIPR